MVQEEDLEAVDAAVGIEEVVVVEEGDSAREVVVEVVDEAHQEEEEEHPGEVEEEGEEWSLIVRDWPRRKRSKLDRLAPKEDGKLTCRRGAESVSESESETEQEEDEEMEDLSSDEEELTSAPTVKPYAALLQSLAADAPPAKRRKVDTSSAPADESDSDNDEDMEELAHVDEVEEEEEGPETAIDGTLDDDTDDEEEDLSDPFEAHFANPDNNVLARRLKNLKKNVILQKKELLKIGRAVVAVPESDEQMSMPAPITSPAGLKLKQKLAGPITKQRAKFDDLESTMAGALFNYKDVLFCERHPSNSERLRRLACLHAVNHVYKTRDRVIKNNAKLAKEEASGNTTDLDLRDQGFTRPKVLMLLPTRESCVRMVNMIKKLTEPEQEENRKRFDDSYVEKEDKFSPDKAEDFRELFAGNDDDMFRLGLKFTRKTVKYFSQFYNSDIILASPLGLRMAIGTDETKKIDADFLSSIEMVIVDQADALLMQNWEHVEYIMEHLNLQPKEAHGCDFSRVRNWYLDDQGKYFRQTIALAAFNTPELNTLFFNGSKNWEGKTKIQDKYQGVIEQLGMKVKQTFSRIESPSLVNDPEARFTYFTSAIVPQLVRHSKGNEGTLIFVPSYLDFVRVRNYFATSPVTAQLSFGAISEYTSVRDVARARSHFLTGRHTVLLYTERAHHFRRYQIRGIRKVVMYALPDNPVFYKEITAGYLGRTIQDGKMEGQEASVRVLFSKWDVMKLERVAGSERVGRMVMDRGDTFDFV